MLIIRREQMEVFRLARERRFEERALAHLKDHLPERCAVLGDAAVRETIRNALGKARHYGFEEEYDILRLLNLMYTLGFEFDSDARYPWARETLEMPDLRPRARMDLLVQQAMDTLRPSAAAEQSDWLPHEPDIDDTELPEETAYYEPGDEETDPALD
jgi:hypothetical protein